ncbi:MAG: Hsp20/alpha crystallin family protein [Lachnospiraceae bacterium]|nr:Hsp20/alpha crystallin family protein [Lachnospiraceae bacterium]
MLLPRLFGEDLLDEIIDFPDPREFAKIDRKLYGKHAAQVMRTDVHESEEGYEVDIDLPGFKKEEINLTLEDGYLSVSAAKSLDKDKKDLKGRLIRQERYAGSMQRSFYVGEGVKEEDVKAKFEDGVLKLSVPKAEQPKIPERHTIAIAG